MKRKVVLLLVALLAANFASAQRRIRLPKGKSLERAIATQTLQNLRAQSLNAARQTKALRELSTLLKNDRYLRGDMIRNVVKNQSMDMLRYLANDRDLSSQTWDAVFYDPALTRKLVEAGVMPSEDNYSSAVFVLQLVGDPETINFLCERGNPSAKTKHKMLSDVIMSSRGGELHRLNLALDLLNKFHADINPDPNTFVLYPKDRASAPHDILSGLARDGFKPAASLRFALEHGANPNLVFKDTGNSIYYQLILDKDWGGLKIFREYGAKLEGEMLEKANHLLHEKIADEAFTRVLIDAGADPNFKLDGLTPLERATQAWKNAESSAEEEQINNVMKFYQDLSAGTVEPYYNEKGEPLYWKE